MYADTQLYHVISSAGRIDVHAYGVHIIWGGGIVWCAGGSPRSKILISIFLSLEKTATGMEKEEGMRRSQGEIGLDFASCMQNSKEAGKNGKIRNRGRLLRRLE